MRCPRFIGERKAASYLVAILLAVVTFLIKWGLGGYIDRPAMILFVLPIMLSALWGGLGPGLVATVLSAFGAAWILPPHSSLRIAGSLDLIQWWMLCVIGLVISFLNEAYRRSSVRTLEAERLSTQAATREQTLRESEEQLLRTFRRNPIPQAIIRISDGKYVDVNEGFAQLIGYSREDLIGRTSPEFGLFESMEKRAEIYRIMREQGWIRDLDAVIVTRSGQQRAAKLWANRIAFAGAECSLSSLIDISERKRAEEEIQKSQTLLSEAEMLSHTGAWEWDLVSKRWAFSSEWLRIHGVQTVTHASNVLIRVVHPKDRPGIEKALEEARKGLKRFNLEHRIIREDTCETRVVRAAGQFVRDSSDNVVRVYGFAQDITAQRQAQEELRKERDFISAVLETVASQVIVLDSTGNIVSFNRACERVTGLSRSEVEGKPLLELLIPHAEREQVREIFQQLRMGHFPGPYENHWRTRDGSMRLFAWSNKAIPGEDGNIRYIIGTGTDITESRRAEGVLKESEAKFRAVFEQAAVGMGRVDFRNACWIDANAALCRILGYSNEEMRATPWPKITHPDDLDVDLQPFRQMAAGELQSYSIEKRYLHKEGYYVWVRLTLSLVRNRAGEPDYEIAVVEDITERKRAEGALKNAVKARDEFLSIASHELKTPLSSLRLQAQLMKRGVERKGQGAYAPEKINWFADQADRQVSRLVRLVDDMLDVSRIESGKLIVQPEKVVFSEIVKDVVERLCPQMVAVGIEPILDRLEEIEGVWDRFRMEQVVTNLLTNAMRYGNGKPVKISLRCQGKHELLLSVQDQGVGISKEDQSRIFERFERVASVGNHAGLGLGLFISSEIVKMHGGRIWVESELGRGSTFFVLLPLRYEYESAQKASA